MSEIGLIFLFTPLGWWVIALIGIAILTLGSLL